MVLTCVDTAANSVACHVGRPIPSIKAKYLVFLRGNKTVSTKRMILLPVLGQFINSCTCCFNVGLHAECDGALRFAS